MDAATFPIMLGFPPHIPVSPPPDHKLLFKHSPSQGPAVGIANPLLLKSFAREMEAPAVKKAPSLLEKHFAQQQLLREKAEKAKVLEAQNQAQAHKQSLLSPPLQPCCDSSSSTLTSSTNTTDSSATKVEPQPDTKVGVPAPAAAAAAAAAATAAAPASQQQQQQQAQRPVSPPENPFLNHAGLLDSSLSGDPKYIQMVSRMAAYYQQRCQAILNYQQQRCQTWASSHRQKCQEMMQAAMLVVAWYIRDRIGRRRRRNKRSFRRGLREKNSAAAARRGGGAGAGAGRGVPTKGESVRRWVMGIPEAALSPNNGMRDDVLLDREEREFDVEKEVVPDKDSQLFLVADQMIKSQLAKIDVPLLGALNLDDSDSESESDDEDRLYPEPEDYEMEDEEDGDEEYDDDDDDDDDLEYEEESEDYVEDVASREAMHGTGKGSLKRKRSESTSVVE